MKNWILLLVIGWEFSAGWGHFSHASVWAEKRMKIDTRLNQEIEEVLSMAADFHSLRVSQKEEQARQAAGNLIKKLSHAKSVSEKIHDVQSVHIAKILDSAQSSLQSFNNNPSTEDGLGGVKNFFKEVVQITQVFDVKKYKIFFCPLDRALWLQKDANARNPVNIKFLKCGKPV